MKDYNLREGFLVFVFDTTSASMNADKRAKGQGLRYQTIPTPTEISSGCGIALLFKEEDKGRIEAFFESLPAPFRVYYQRDEKREGVRETRLVDEKK